jgi:hypothetical protein
MKYQHPWRAKLNEVASRHRVAPEDILGPSRRRAFAWPRHELMAELYATGNYSLPQIGRWLGGRDHTTVLHGVRVHAKRLAERAAACVRPATRAEAITLGEKYFYPEKVCANGHVSKHRTSGGCYACSLARARAYYAENRERQRQRRLV